MALFSATANVTNGLDTITVVGLALSPAIAFPGAQIALDGELYFLDEIINTTTLRLTRNYTGANASGIPLEINTISEDQTTIVTLNDRTSDLIEDLLTFDPLGNLASISPLTGNGVIMQDATGAHSLVPKTDLVSGVDVDGRAQTIAERNTKYGSQTADFSVLVNNIGDGRSAVYYKLSNAANDWSSAAFVTGPVGPTPSVTASATTLAPGSSATVTTTPITGGVNLGLGIPAGEGFVSRGAYSAATAYVKGDVVLNNNSSWIAKIATTSSAPPVLPTTSNTWWELIAAKGLDGTGTGDVVGPASAVTNRIAVFSGTTGKLIKDGGVSLSDVSSSSKRVVGTNLLPSATFIKGIGEWATPRSTSETTVQVTFLDSITDYTALYYGRSMVQLYAESVGKTIRLGGASQFSVDTSQIYKIGATMISDGGPIPVQFRVSCYSAAGAPLGILTIDAPVPDGGSTTPNSNLFTGLINPVGGASPAWPDGTIAAYADVGFVSTAAQGLYVSSFWMIAGENFPGGPMVAPVNAAAGGTHEAVTVGDYMYVINHSLNNLALFDRSMKRVSVIGTGNYPHDIISLGDSVWIVNQNAATVQRVHAVNFTIDATYNIPNGRLGFGLATDGVRLWCGAGSASIGGATPAIYEVNTTTGAFTLVSSDVEEGTQTNIPLQHYAGSLWSAHLTNGQVKRINPTGGGTLATIQCGLGPIYGLGVGEGFVFANCRLGIAKINPATNSVVGTYRYRKTVSGQSNVKVVDGKAYGCSSSGVLIVDIANDSTQEITLDSGGNKWVCRAPSGRGVIVGVYAGPWMFTIG